MMPQMIAFYFPQFHSIPENDLWWGKGFHDWMLVKNAKPNFKGHNQPRVPLNGYYNPCDKDVLKFQIDLAHEYGISGFMFYHYWFDGKLLLEKPLETFLKHKDLNMQFCLCWANETWTRSWSGHPESILIKQNHKPDEKLWNRHFQYLLPFLQDPRAIRINGKIVFIIYQPALIERGDDMLNYWRMLAQQAGLGDLYFIAIKNHNRNKVSTFLPYDGILKFQPREAYTSNKFAQFNKSTYFSFLRYLPESILKYLRKIYQNQTNYQVYDSKILWDIILSNAFKPEMGLESKDIYESAYFEWDNTPRYGKKSKIFTRLSDLELRDNLSSLVSKARDHQSQYVFFNAWNEWSESAYLEPDTKTGYANLQIIKQILELA